MTAVRVGSDLDVFAKRVQRVVVALALAGVLAAALAARAYAPLWFAPEPAAADLAGVWCGSSGDRLVLRKDASWRLDSISDDYLSHHLLVMWGEEPSWHTYFGEHRPASAEGTWHLTDDDFGNRHVRLDLGVRQAKLSDDLRVEHDRTRYELVTNVGPIDSGWSYRFIRDLRHPTCATST